MGDLSGMSLEGCDLAARGYAGAWAFDGGDKASAMHLPDLADARMPEPHQVLVWLGAVDDEATIRSMITNVLDDVTSQAIDRLRDTRDRAASLVAHAGLRMALGSMLRRAPLDIRLARRPSGKPFLPDSSGLEVSINHTRGVAGFAVARRPIGLDVERVAAPPDLLATADAAFAVEMRNALLAVSDAERPALFHRFWTLGEAYVKATGLGVSQGLQSFAFTSGDPPRLSRATPGWGPPERWRFGVL